ncbi:thioredoxin family protein [Agarivorans sp. 1_MG-2023]|uniref:thioredoxin family protein n=1 Tax=Agarivorans sp. 1_MG-2023 TaxID=3062634 RepID=UPI0026E1D0C8|nr:thioredoxin family protein [Agarivorans sp. 1_MG-2023]
MFTDKECNGEIVKLKANNSNFSEEVKGLYNDSKWYRNYPGYIEAIELSERINVPIFLYFQAGWCGYCRQLEKELLSTYRGKTALKRIIKVNISPEAGDDESLLFETLGGKGYPTVFMQNQFDMPPTRLTLKEKINGEWKTKSVDYLDDIIDSSIKSIQ